jgi:hypothetical protein
VKPVLLDPSSATLDQNNQDDDNQHTRSNLNNRGSVHHNSSFFQQNVCCAPRFEQLRATPGAMMAKSPVRKTADRPEAHAFTSPPEQNAALLDPRAASLDQNDQQDNCQSAAYDLDDECSVHCDSSFPQ